MKKEKLFAEAMKEYHTKEYPTIKCNKCNSVIEFMQSGNAIAHNCKCGKFKGSFR